MQQVQIGMFAKDNKCSNCGKYGHNYKLCTAPVTSYGVILFRYVDSEPQYLLIQRRDSLGYIEILRGKYRITDEKYLQTQVNGMTDAEREKICTKTFEELWTALWQNGTTPSHYHKSEQETAKHKFNYLRDEGVFKRLCETAPKSWPTPEWGFPKGRRDSKEADIECALRELWEETGVAKEDIHLLENVDPFFEDFQGTNGVRYCHKYYLATCDIVEAHTHLFNLENPHIAREIGDIQWLFYEEALSKIRSDNIEKRTLLLEVNRFLKSVYPLFIPRSSIG